MPVINPEALSKQVLHIFGGRTDTYLSNGYRANKPITEAIVRRHLIGEERIGIYPNDYMGWMCFDFDGKKHPGGKEVGRKEAFQNALQLRQHLGVGILELSRSGCGYHLWIFFDMPWPTVTEIKRIGKAMLSSCELPSDEKEPLGHAGIYPHPKKAKEEGGEEVGKTPFLPWYGYLAGNKTGLFVDATGSPYEDQIESLRDVGRTTYSELRSRFPEIVSGKVTSKGIVRETNKSRHETILEYTMRLRNHLTKDGTRYLVRSLAKTLGLESEGRSTEVERIIDGAYGKPARQVRTQFDIEQEIGTEIYDIRHTPVREIAQMKQIEPDYLIDNFLLPAETVIIASPPGAGKSMIAMSLALSAAAGKPVFGQFDVTDPLRVLYVNEEMSDTEFAKRINKLALGANIDLADVEDNLLIFPQQGLVLNTKNATAFNTFKERVAAFKPHIVIIDTFTAIFGGEEKDATEIRQWYNQIVVWLRQTVGAAVIVQHHVRKPSTEEKFNFDTTDDTSLLYSIRGSGDLSGAFERVIMLWKKGDTQTDFGLLVNLSVRNPKARSGDKIPPFDIVVDDISILATTVLSTKGIKSPFAAKHDASVKHALLLHESCAPYSELLEDLIADHKISDRSARRWIAGAMKRGVCSKKSNVVVLK